VLSAQQLAEMRRDQGLTRELMSRVMGRTPRWLMFIEEGRVPLTEEVHDDIVRALITHRLSTKAPGAVVAASQGLNLTSHQQSN
jgi:hypothetical protein